MKLPFFEILISPATALLALHYVPRCDLLQSACSSLAFMPMSGITDQASYNHSMQNEMGLTGLLYLSASQFSLSWWGRCFPRRWEMQGHFCQFVNASDFGFSPMAPLPFSMVLQETHRSVVWIPWLGLWLPSTPRSPESKTPCFTHTVLSSWSFCLSFIMTQNQGIEMLCLN